MTRTPSPETPVSDDEARRLLVNTLRSCHRISRASPYWDDRMREGADAVIENVLTQMDFRDLAEAEAWAEQAWERSEQAAPTPSADVSSLIERVPPFGYAHRYPSFPPEGSTVIRFGTNGREINGSKPLEAIPLYTATQFRAAIAAHDTEAAMRLERYREALEAADKRLCELTPRFPPDVGPDMRDAEEIEKTRAVVMQIRAALKVGA